MFVILNKLKPTNKKNTGTYYNFNQNFIVPYVYNMVAKFVYNITSDKDRKIYIFSYLTPPKGEDRKIIGIINFRSLVETKRTFSSFFFFFSFYYLFRHTWFFNLIDEDFLLRRTFISNIYYFESWKWNYFVVRSILLSINFQTHKSQ